MSSKTNRLLVYPIESTTQLFWRIFDQRLEEYLRQWGLFPLDVSVALPAVMWITVYWLLFVWAFRRRPFASGLCIQTGTVTSSPSSALSPLYLSYSQRSETNHSVRQQVDTLIRRYSHIQRTRAKIWKYFLPGASELILGQSPFQAIFWTFLVSSLGWEGCSSQVRDSFYRWAERNYISEHIAAFPSGEYLVLLSLILYMVCLRLSQRRLNS